MHQTKKFVLLGFAELARTYWTRRGIARLQVVLQLMYQN